MTTRVSFEGPNRDRSVHPNAPNEGVISEDVSAETAGLPITVRSLPTVVILSDIRFLQEVLAEILGREAGLSVIGIAANLVEAQASWPGIHPDIVLLDTTLPDALGAAAAVRELLPKARVIALSVTETEENVITWGEAGVAGYIPRTATLTDVIAAIGNTMRGEQACSARISATLLHRLAEHPTPSPAANQPLLTAREVEIVQLLATGLSNKQIALHLRISLATTKSHVHNLLTKLELPRRGHAAIWLRQHAITLQDAR
ncbi:response regulator transcription factor [Microvirga sp. CF3062]|uniref:response regulator transcription factor n=1 Tax=Microvirga sp. CF3062 TaxID=3110182 RepID=UPI002E77D3DC|nr:response regulator transcription factor [Microvirga sp. CF3062]MEE1658335.1 response regulator transcription factor [Microvirga sp. CF3062]